MQTANGFLSASKEFSIRRYLSWNSARIAANCSTAEATEVAGR